MMRAAGVALVAVVLACTSCGPAGQYLPGGSGIGGTLAGAPFSYEPTGTVFSFVDKLGPEPLLVDKADAKRLILMGSYAYFDPQQDSNRMAGSDLEELRHEVEMNDWIVIERRKADLSGDRGKTFKAVLVRDSTENIFRTVDITSGDNSADFGVKVRFARDTLQRNASYTCSNNAFPPCTAYRPMGSKVSVSATFSEINAATGGSVVVAININVERRDGDPSDALVGSFTGKLSGAVVEERVAETNFRALGLYDQTKLEE